MASIFEIPAKCNGCEPLKDILQAPVTTFDDALFAETGRHVTSATYTIYVNGPIER